MDAEKYLPGESAPPLVVRIQGSSRSLPAGPSYLVGRDPGGAIAITDGRVSWRHAVARLTQEELAEATSLRSISDLEHLRRDNTMITTNPAAVSAKYYRTHARTGTMARFGSSVSAGLM